MTRALLVILIITLDAVSLSGAHGNRTQRWRQYRERRSTQQESLGASLCPKLPSMAGPALR